MSRSYHQVLLYLLIQLVQLAVVLVQRGAGLMVALLPLVEVLLLQVLIGQNQRPQSLPCKLLHIGVHVFLRMNSINRPKRQKSTVLRTFRCSVVTSISLLQDWWSLS